jgi:hypothetical protein
LSLYPNYTNGAARGLLKESTKHSLHAQLLALQ